MGIDILVATAGEDKLKFYAEPDLQSTGPWSFGSNRSPKIEIV